MMSRVPKKAVSITLDEANLLWLKRRGQGNLSAAVDDLITAARTGGLGAPAVVRSVVGTINIAVDDPHLARADAAVRDLFVASLTQPLRVSEKARRTRELGGRGVVANLPVAVGTADQIDSTDDLRFTRDPFDALIVAAARTLALPLLTRDESIRASGAVRVIW
jgi:hypothetical protein